LEIPNLKKIIITTAILSAQLILASSTM